jgi:AraC-like DNA-binding protein
VIVINPGDAHDGRSGDGGFYSYRMMYVPVELMRAFVEDSTARATGDPGFVAPLLDDPVLARRLGAAWEALADGARTMAAETLLADALPRLCGHSALRVTGDTRLDRGALERVRDYLHARVEDEVRVTELAQLASMSRFKLTRQFERAFGLPLHAYHLHLKLEEAKRRLRSRSPIARVAADLGFADQSHFHRRFKGAYGITPAAWRCAAQRA